MKTFIKVIGTIFSIIGALICGIFAIDAIICKRKGVSFKKYLSDAFNYGYEYFD